MFRLAKTSAVKARTQAINQLKAVLVRTEPGLRESLAGLGRTTLVRRCAALDVVEPTDTATAARYALRQLAIRIVALTAEIEDLNRRLAAVLNRHAPALLARVGVGPDTAAALLIVAGDNPRRLTSDRSFTALCGVSPIEASSGKTADTASTAAATARPTPALHRIVITRLRCDPRTRAYQQRRLAEGKTPREIVRCLKRYIAREIYNAIPRISPPATAAT
ncbi:transposase [Frankia sp. Cpl3]|nr:transposase [Frankia sp. Cpl3]